MTSYRKYDPFRFKEVQWVLPVPNTFNDPQTENYCKFCCTCSKEGQIKFSGQNWYYSTDIVNVKFIRILKEENENEKALTNLLNFVNPLKSEKKQYKNIVFSLEKYFDLFMNDIKKYMFEYVDVQGVDCNNLQKSTMFNLYNYFREQSQRQYNSLEDTVKKYISQSFIYSDFLKKKYKDHSEPMKKKCPSIFDWKNWFMINFDNFKDVYFNPGEHHSHKTPGEAQVITQITYNLNLMMTSEDLIESIDFMTFSLEPEYPEVSGGIDEEVVFPEDPNQSMFEDKDESGFKNDELPDLSIVEKAISPLKKKLYPIIQKEISKVTDQFVDKPIESPGGPVELELKVRYKFFNCSTRPKFVINNRNIGTELSPPMVTNENTFKYYISFKEFDGIKDDISKGNLESGYSLDDFYPTPGMAVFLQDNLKYVNQSSGALMQYYENFIGSYKDILIAMADARKFTRVKECTNMCSCVQYKQEVEEKKG